MRILLVACAALALGGCALFDKDAAPPVCDGKDRRPANVHGSVLDVSASAPVELSAAPVIHGSCQA